MAFSSLPTGSEDEPLSEINMIPLIDVMLVLLIVFMITVPVMQHAVKVDLPKASNAPAEPAPQAIELTIDAEGRYFWGNEAVDDAALAARLKAAGALPAQPELQIRADRAVRYERVAAAMASAQRAGLRQIGFITDPGAP